MATKSKARKSAKSKRKLTKKVLPKVQNLSLKSGGAL
jgi:hypothetical protein